MNNEFRDFNLSVFPTATLYINEGNTQAATKYLDKQYSHCWHNLSDMNAARETGKIVFQYEFQHHGIERALQVLREYKEKGQHKFAVIRFVAQHYQDSNDQITSQKISDLMISQIEHKEIPRLNL